MRAESSFSAGSRPRLLLWTLIVFAMGLSVCQCHPNAQLTPLDQPPTEAQQEGITQYHQRSTPTADATPAPPRSPAVRDKPVFDLLKNRPLGHRRYQDDDQVAFALDASSADFARYIQGNHTRDWSLWEEVDDEPAAIVKGRRAKLWFPAWKTQGLQRLTMKLHNPQTRAVVLKARLNGKHLKPQRLEPGWQEVAWEFVASIVREENALELEFDSDGRYGKQRSGGALRWLWLGDLRADARLIEHDQGPTQQGEWRLKPKHGLAWQMWVMPKTSLELNMRGPAGCGVRFKLWSQDGSGALKLELDKAYMVSEQPHSPARHELSQLQGIEGSLVRVSIEHSGHCDRPVDIFHARQFLPNQPVLKAQQQPPAPKYVVMWKVDTLRADYLPFYGDAQTYTPTMSKIVEEGAMVKTAFVQGNESRVSHASLFSGLYPSRHGVTPEGRLKEELTLLPEAIKAAGFKTIARASNGYVSKPYGYEQGWDNFRNELREGYAYDGKSIMKQVIPLLQEHKDQPFFLYVGTIDPHATYRKHEGLLERYDNEPYEGRFKTYITGKNLGEINRRVLLVDERDKQRIKALYRNEITFNDEALAMLRQELEQLGLWQDTLLIITADHGDGFWEHRKVGHGHNLHQELVHVPMVISYPRGIKPKTVINNGADVLDIYPTIMEALGQARPQGLQGQSLWPWLTGEQELYPRPATSNFELKRYTMQLGPFKLIWDVDGSHQLYDRDQDPLELSDVQDRHPMAKRWVMDSLSYLRMYRSSWDKSTWGVGSDLSSEFIYLSQRDREYSLAMLAWEDGELGEQELREVQKRLFR